MIKIERVSWKLTEWNEHFAQESDQRLPPMTKEEINFAIEWLRSKNYPKPEDCPWENCPNLRPTCKLGICQIAVGMCGDF